MFLSAYNITFTCVFYYKPVYNFRWFSRYVKLLWCLINSKEKKFKVQVSIQGDQLRISGKDKDALQEVIAFIRQEQNRANIDIQIVNLRG